MEKSILITIILLTLCTTALSQSADSIKFQSLEPYDFHLQYLRQDSALLIDAREFFEYRRSRIYGSLFLPPSKGFEIFADTLDKEFALWFFFHELTPFPSLRSGFSPSLLKPPALRKQGRELGEGYVCLRENSLFLP